MNRSIVTTDTDNQLMVLSLKDDKIADQRVVKTKQKEPTCAVFSLDGCHLFVGSKDNVVNCYKYPSLEFEALISRSDHTITSLSINRKNIIAIGSMSEKLSVQIIDVSNNEEPKTIRTISTQGGTVSVKINDNDVIALLNRNREFSLFKLDEEDKIFSNSNHISKDLLSFWNNQSKADALCPLVMSWHLCSDSIITPNSTLITDIDGWKKSSLGKIDVNNYIASFSPNSVHAAMIDIDKNINLYEVDSLTSKRPRPYQSLQMKSLVTSIEWSATDNKFYVCTLDGKVHLIKNFVNLKKQKTTYKAVDCERYIKSLQMMDDDDIMSLIETEPPKKQPTPNKSKPKIHDDIDSILNDREEELEEQEEIEPLEVVDLDRPTLVESQFKEDSHHAFETSIPLAPYMHKHQALQPTSSPFEKVGNDHKRYLAVTQHIGLITASVTNMTPDRAPYYNIHIKFNLAGHSEEKYQDNNKPHVAALSENGIVFGSNPNNLNDNGVISFRKLRLTHQDKGWKSILPHDEKILCVTLGSSFVAAAIEKENKGSTRTSFVKVKTKDNLDLGNIAIGGNIVSLCGSDNNLVIVYQQGTCLFLDWYDINMFSCVKAHRPLPCSELAWIGFGTGTKDLLYVFDSTQILYLMNPDTDSFSAWCDLKKGENTHFISIINDSTIYSILCNNQKGVPTATHDMTSFKLNATNVEDVFIGSSIDLEKGHDKSVKLSYFRYFIKNIYFNQSFRKGNATKEGIVEIDRLIVTIITRCIELKEYSAALNFAKLLRMKSSLNIIANFAESQKDIKLSATLKNTELFVQESAKNPAWPHSYQQSAFVSTPSTSTQYMTKEQVSEVVKQLLKSNTSSTNVEIINTVSPVRIESQSPVSSRSLATISPTKSDTTEDKLDGEVEFQFESESAKPLAQMFSPKRPKKKSIDNNLKKKITSKSTSVSNSSSNPFLALNEKNTPEEPVKTKDSNNQSSTSSNILSRISSLGGEDKKRKRVEEKQTEEPTKQVETKKKKQPISQPSVLEFVKKNVAIPKLSSSELSSTTKEALFRASQTAQDDDDLDVSGILN